MRSILLVLMVAIGLIGCKGKPAEHLHAAAPATLPGGWTKVENLEDGVSLGAPTGWKSGTGQAFDLLNAFSSGMGGSSSDMGADPNSPFGQMSNDMEAKAAAEEEQAVKELRKKGVLINVIDTTSRPIVGEQRTMFRLKMKEHEGNVTLPEAVAEEREFMLGAGPDRKVTLPIGNAIRLDAEVETRGGDKVRRIGYVLVDGNRSYSLRFVSTNNPTAIEQIAEGVADSLRILPGKNP